MNLENLYDMVDKENIKLYDRYIDNTYGAFIHINDINAIVMNYKEIDSTAIEKATLAEELRTLLHGCHISTFLYG